MHDLRLCRTILFLPASNPRAIAKARELPADMIVLDLEDAVRPEDKASARAAAREALREGFGGRPVAIRVNVIGSAWYGEDVVAIRHSGADYAILPKAETHRQVHDTKVLVEIPVLAMIETARGVLAAASIAPGSAGLIAGTNDLAADLRLPAGAGRGPLQMALQSIVLAARAGKIAVFDGVYNRLDDERGFAAEAAEGREMGFDGKSLIHPSQIGPCHMAFAPSAEEIARAERLVAAATGGAERFEGAMIERMHVEAARRLLARNA